MVELLVRSWDNTSMMSNDATGERLARLPDICTYYAATEYREQCGSPRSPTLPS